MAKIASSKPYGSGSKSKTNTPTRKERTPSELASPVRTSPRRKKPAIEELQPEEPVEKVEERVKKTSKKLPVAPKFNENSKKKNEKSPKSTRGRRKSLIEPEPVIIAPTEAEAETETEVEPEAEEEYDYVDSVQSSSIYNRNPDENSPIFEQEIQGPNENVEYPEYSEYVNDFDIDNDNVNEEYDQEYEQYEGEDDDSQVTEEYNEQFKYTSESVKARLAQYFNRQERTGSPNMTTSITSSLSRSQMWNRMKNWISDNLLVGARELGGVTIEYTKRAIEEITKRLEPKPTEDVFPNRESSELAEMETTEEEEPRIFEIIDEEEDEVENCEERKKAKLMDVDRDDDVEYKFVSSAIEPQDHQLNSSSFHSLPPEHDVTVILPSVSEEESSTAPEPVPFVSDTFKYDVMESRLTELVLFFAKCSNDTPLPTIYEHLEEFFTLKGENALNFTEKQLISAVLKEYLTEKQPAETAEAGMSGVNSVNFALDSASSSPKRIKVLPSSGIRFRAPKFTAEEEAHLEELEQVRQKNLAASNSARMTTPLQRSKLQKKLLAPEMIAEDIEKMPESRGKISVSKKKDDSVNVAIEDIISQKIKEAKQKEEAERIETEKLKARVAELERESRDRATKEALLQKQLEEQKKELEIERQAAKEKIEKIKAEKPVEIKNKSSFTSSSISDEKPPFAETSGGFKSFSFGATKSEEKTVDKVDSTLNPSAPAFKPFVFGAAKKEPETVADTESKQESTTNLGGFGFSFGAKVEESAGKKEEPVKPAFNFGSTKTEEPAKPAFNFGSVKTENSAKPAFNFGSTKTEETVKSAFNFGAVMLEKSEEPVKTDFAFGASKSEDTKPAFNFGKPEESKSAFSFGSSKSEEAKPAFNFGSSKPDEAKPAFNFGSSKPEEAKPALNFGSSKPAFNLGSETKPVSSSSSSSTAFNFGSTKPDESKPAFNFGSAKTEEQPVKPAVTFNFGGSKTEGTTKPPVFNFGSNFNIPSSSSTLNNTTNSFGFGQSNNNFNSTNSTANNPFAALNSAPNIFNSSTPVSFNFGNNNSTVGGNTFNIPTPLQPGGIVPMNFGNPSNSSMETSEGGFQTGRSISIPKRRILRK